MLRREPEIRRANESLVRNFVEQLPQATVGGQQRAFVANTAQEARMIQSSALFMYGAAGEEHHLSGASYSDIAPAYLIGTKPNPAEQLMSDLPDVLLLMVEAYGDHNFRILGTWWPELHAIEDRQAALEGSGYKDGQVRKMFHEKTGNLVVDAFEPDSIAFRQHTLDLNRGYPKRRRNRLTTEQKIAHRTSWSEPGIRGGPIINWHNTNFDKNERECTFTDDFLLSFGVLEKLGDLATKFGQKDQLKTVIDSHTVDFIDPMDQLLEE